MAVAASGAVYLTQAESEDPQDVCVERLSEHRDEAFTGPTTDEQIEEYCRYLLR